MPHVDPQARREYHREYMRRYLADPARRAKHGARVARAKAASRERSASLIAEAKAGGCVTCGESDPACLDFHHGDPSTKEFAIGARADCIAPARLLAEIEKCDVLCSNCHRKLHGCAL